MSEYRPKHQDLLRTEHKGIPGITLVTYIEKMGLFSYITVYDETASDGASGITTLDIKADAYGTEFRSGLRDIKILSKIDYEVPPPPLVEPGTWGVIKARQKGTQDNFSIFLKDASGVWSDIDGRYDVSFLWEELEVDKIIRGGIDED